MVSLDDTHMLTLEGYTIVEIVNNGQLFSELLGHVEEAGDPHAVLANITYITEAMVSDDITRIDVLKWLLAFSEHLNAVPIRFLMENKPLFAADTVIMAADAHFFSPVEVPQEPAPPTDGSNVVSLSAIRNRKRRIC